ncbi:MAG: hypothetical protein CMP13_07050 [Zunongwangia sp.]|nr:hypothetical protein [Flavobacteriaceae bacterium]MAS70376.1 hypothetical protein [Zunongwangia sp.]HAJ81363.1 hypothetical protein [Zunongwangia profunda]
MSISNIRNIPQSKVLRNVKHSIKLRLPKPEQFNLNIVGIEVLILHIKTIKKAKDRSFAFQ